MTEQVPTKTPGFSWLEEDRLHEECGVFGIFNHPDAAALTAGPDLGPLLVAGAHGTTSLGVTGHGHSLRLRARDQRAPAAVSSSAMPVFTWREYT